MSELELPVAATAEAIREILAGARAEAHRAVNSVMVQAYWQVGRVLVEQEQAGEERAEYGARLVRQVAERLTAEFGRGYDHRNLWYMRGFYLAFPKVNALRSLLTWNQYCRLVRADNTRACEFYVNEWLLGPGKKTSRSRASAQPHFDRRVHG